MAGGKKRKAGGAKRKTTVPRLPKALQKEIEFLNPTDEHPSDEDHDDLHAIAAADIYEYEEGLPEEDTKKNKRFDPVDNYEYELPDDFQDEDVESEEDSDERDDDDADDDEARHSRMLQKITGLPADAFDGRSRKNDIVVSEAYPESEYNPSRDILEGDGRISIEDLLDPLHGKSGYGELRKELTRMGRTPSLHAPLPKPDQEKIERKVAYAKSKEEVTKWEPLVKRNREAPTIYFDEDTDVGYSTVGAIASEFEPRSEFERKMASLHRDIGDAHKEDGARLLELNKISVEEVKDQQSRLAKMRSLLFRHEVKAKRIRKIKSKTYHRMLKKDKMKETTAMMEMDPDAGKELAMKQEFKRAEERLTLKHKNSSKWAKRILQRGLAVQDDGTRAAISAQLSEHAILTRKMNSMKESSDESSDEDESDVDLDQDDPSLLLKKAKKRTLEILEGDEELPNSGVLSLPFMVRGAKKRKEEAEKEARTALDDYELSLKQLEEKNEEHGKNLDVSNGKRIFGPTKGQVKKVKERRDKKESDGYYGNSDGEESLEAEEDVDDEHDKNYNDSLRDVNIDPDVLRRESEIGHDALFKSFEEIVKDPGPRTTCEVAIVTSNSRRKKKNSSQKSSQQTGDQDNKISYSAKTKKYDLHSQDAEEECGDSDSDSEEQMVDGILSSGPRSTYQLPSQEELIRRAFAGDDVEEDFEKDKEDILNQEVPEPEKPSLLPGWGQWTDVQKKKGLPSWMLKENENAKKKREEVLKKRRDADLKHVIISEKLDKKAEKLHTKALPFPYTSKEVFEQSIRMPIGPEFNPATAIGALNRPEVVKKPGVIIKPIKHEDINPHERSEDPGNRKRKHQMGKSKQRNKKSVDAKAS